MGTKSKNLERIEQLLRENKRTTARIQSRMADIRSHVPEATLAAPPPLFRGTAEPTRRGSPTVGLQPGVAQDMMPPVEPEAGELMQAVMPEIQRSTPVFEPGLKHYAGRHQRALRPSYESIHSLLGVGSIRQLRHERRNRPHPKARAIFFVLMVLLLGTMFFRMIT